MRHPGVFLSSACKHLLSSRASTAINCCTGHLDPVRRDDLWLALYGVLDGSESSGRHKWLKGMGAYEPGVEYVCRPASGQASSLQSRRNLETRFQVSHDSCRSTRSLSATYCE